MPCRRRHTTTKRRLDSYTHTHTHTRCVLCAYVYVYHYMRAEPVCLVRDRVEDRSSAATTNGSADGRQGDYNMTACVHLPFRLSDLLLIPTPAPGDPPRYRARLTATAAFSIARDRPPPTISAVVGSTRARARAACIQFHCHTHRPTHIRITGVIAAGFLIFYFTSFLMVV